MQQPTFGAHGEAQREARLRFGEVFGREEIIGERLFAEIENQFAGARGARAALEILEHFLLGPRSGRGGSIGGVRFELGEAEAVEVFGVYDVALVIPARGALDGGGEIPNGFPAELFAGFVNGKGKGSGFMRGGWVGGIGPFAGPVFEKIFHEFAHGTLGFRRRAEVEGFGKGSILAQTRAEPKVAG